MSAKPTLGNHNYQFELQKFQHIDQLNVSQQTAEFSH